MEKKIRTIIGLAVIGISLWLAVWIERKDATTAEILQKSFAVAYTDSLGGNESPVYDSTLYTLPYLLMRAGDLTANNTCPVKGGRLNKRVQPLFVNGRAIGFC